ncbi:hypothetical protein Tco_1336017 [Tanacetum coccineum]
MSLTTKCLGSHSLTQRTVHFSRNGSVEEQKRSSANSLCSSRQLSDGGKLRSLGMSLADRDPTYVRWMLGWRGVSMYAQTLHRPQLTASSQRLRFQDGDGDGNFQAHEISSVSLNAQDMTYTLYDVMKDLI